MESASVPRRLNRPAGDESSGGDKGLKKDAIGFASSVVIGVASTAPGYSLAATLGFVVAAVGLQAPAVLLVSLRADVPHRRGLLLHEPRRPGLRHQLLLGDAGRSARSCGWITGWAIVVADIIVMANLAQIAGALHLPRSSAGDAAADIDRSR